MPARLLRSGWIPAVLVLLFASWLLKTGAQVGFRDQAFYAGYIAGWILLPGTLIWRLVDRRGTRPLVEDLSIGALVGFVVEFPVYLGCLGLGHPRWYLLWPVAVLAIALSNPRGRAALIRRGPRMPAAWSWSVGGLLGYVVLWYAHNAWGPTPAHGPNLRAPYVDEPFHQSLIASLRHFSPPKVLYVDDTPLNYHYLSHVHMAAGSWVSGIDPIVILRGLAMPTVVILVLLALATTASRLSGRTWLGPLALAGILVLPANFNGGSNGGSGGFLDIHFQTSPSAGFANAAMLLGVVLVLELLRKENAGIGLWALTGLSMVAMCGAKATTLPTLIAGLFAAAVVGTALTRRLAVRPLALLVLAGVAFLAARLLFFGSSAQGIAWDPLAIYGRTMVIYPGLAGPDGEMAFSTSLLIALSVLSVITLGAGLLAGLLKGGWREPAPVFLVVLCAAGYGAALAFHQQGYSEGYFIIAVQLPLLLGAALGIARHADDLLALSVGLGRHSGRKLVALTVGSGFAAGLLYTAINRPIDIPSLEGSPAVQAFRIVGIPILTVLLGGAAVTMALLALLRRTARNLDEPPRPRVATYLAVAALVFAGVGMAPTFYRVKAILSDPVPAPVASSPNLIAPGGIMASRWLRDHTPLDAVVATNAHCERPHRPVCTPRHFWMSAYAERQFLVEGWAYVSRATVGLKAPKAENLSSGPFWDPQRLADNDAAFLEPSTENLDRLRDEHGVGWLLVDRRYPADTRTLGKLADLRLAVGRYLVYELR